MPKTFIEYLDQEIHTADAGRRLVLEMLLRSEVEACIKAAARRNAA